MNNDNSNERIAELELDLQSSQAVIFDITLRLSLLANAAFVIAKNADGDLDIWALQRSLLQLRRETETWVSTHILADSTSGDALEKLLH